MKDRIIRSTTTEPQGMCEQYPALIEQIHSLHVKLWSTEENNLTPEQWKLRNELDCRYGYPRDTEEIRRAVEAFQKRNADAYEAELLSSLG